MMNNFEFIHNDKKYWYSRSIAVVGIIFAKGKDKDWYVMANKRGKNTPDYQGYWNMPCGYLDFNETCVQAILREIFEECGLRLDHKSNEFELIGIDDEPEGRQNVTLRYRCILKDLKDFYVISSRNADKGEVEEAKWINVKDINKYKWAFGHDYLINMNIFS